MAAGQGRGDAVRRGRRESRLDAAAPVHRRAFAQRLRDLRAECYTPPYRVLSLLAHCATGTLSEAAGGRRLPTWETTRAYVTGCLRHAGRDGELTAELDRWRAAWERAARAERKPYTPHLPAPAAVPRVRLGRRTRPLLFLPLTLLVLPLTLLVVLAVSGLRAVRPVVAAPMNGLFNVLLAAPEWTGEGDRPAAADRLHALLEGDLRAWSAGTSTVQTRSPERTPPGDLGTLAAEQNADVVLRPVLSDDGGWSLIAVEVFLADRTLGGTPEYAGVYRLGLLEPPGFHPGVTGDVRPAVLSYRNAVLSLVRGVGAYAYGDFAAAESHFARAGDELRLLGDAGERPVGRSAADLLLGIAVTAQSPARAVAPLERAVSGEDPPDGRAQVALGAALSATVRCERPAAAEVRRLRDADEHYERFLHRPPDDGPGLLDLTARYGLGRNAECQGRAGLDGAWQRAEQEYAEVLRLRETTRLTGASARQATTLAGEALAASGRLPR